MVTVSYVQVNLEYDGKGYIAEKNGDFWMWYFTKGHSYGRGVTIPVPLAVLAEFQKMFPGVEPKNESGKG